MGTVKMTDATALEGGIASILSAKDSSVIKTVAIEGGLFKFTDLRVVNPLLKISAMGFETLLINIQTNKDQPLYDLGNITIAQQVLSLKGVQVDAHRPVLDYVNGNMKVDVQNGILTASSSAQELLSKVPGLTVDGDIVNVIGKGEAIIYYNGERITNERLRSLQPALIKNIEIITNPSSRYDAKGNAVINITGVRSKAEGFTGKIRQDFAVGDYSNEITDLSLDYRINRLSLSGGFNQRTLNRNISINSSYAQDKTSRLQYEGGSIYNSGVSADFIPTYRLGVDYQLDTLSRLSLEYNGNTTSERQHITNDNTLIFRTLDTSSFISTDNHSKVKWWNHSVSLNYSHTLDAKGSNIFAAIQYFEEQYRLNAGILQNIFHADASNFFNHSKERLLFYSARLDYEKKLNKRINITAGLKFTKAASSNRIDFLEEVQGELNEVDQYSNDYKYDEYLPAGYFELSGTLGKVRYNTGVRFEETIAKGFSNKKNIYLLDTSYISPFPFLSLRKTINNVEYGVSYATRIGRPTYDDLDPYVEYNGPSFVVKGSPQLKPSYTHSVEAYRQWHDYLVKIGASYIKNEISSSIYQFSDSGAVTIQKLNLHHSTSLYATVSVPFATKYWSADNTINVSYKRLTDDRFPEKGFNAFPVINLNTSHTFTIPSVFNIELLGNYSSEGNNGIVKTYTVLYTELGLSKKLFNNKLNARLVFQDAANTYYLKATQSYDGHRYTSKREFTNRLVRLSLNYSFGQSKGSAYKNKQAGQDAVDRAR